MKDIEKIIEDQQINEAYVYDEVIEKLQAAKENGTPIDEGLIGAIAGAAGGMIFGPKVMTVICNVLGIDVKGSLGSLMTSRLICTAVAAKLGWRI